MLNLPTGRTASRADFDAARERLTATRAFETVGYEYKLSAGGAGFDFTVDVHEVGEVYPYRFEGLGVPEETLRAALRAAEPLWAMRFRSTVSARYIDTIIQAGVRSQWT